MLQTAAILDYLDDHWDEFGPEVKRMAGKMSRIFAALDREAEKTGQATTPAEMRSIFKTMWMEFGRFFVVFMDYTCSQRGRGDCSNRGFPVNAFGLSDLFTYHPGMMYVVFQSIFNSTRNAFRYHYVTDIDPEYAFILTRPDNDLEEAGKLFLKQRGLKDVRLGFVEADAPVTAPRGW